MGISQDPFFYSLDEKDNNLNDRSVCFRPIANAFISTIGRNYSVSVSVVSNLYSSSE